MIVGNVIWRVNKMMTCKNCGDPNIMTDGFCGDYRCKTNEVVGYIATEAHEHVAGCEVCRDSISNWNKLYPIYHPLEVKVKKLHPDAKLPYKQYEGDACFDLYAVEDVTITGHQMKKVRFGIAWEIPRGYEAVVRGRSSSFVNKELHVFVGTVDQQYRGEIICAVALLFPLGSIFSPDDAFINSYTIKKGEAIAQVAFREVPNFHIVEVDKLTDTYRGAKGFGSTDKKRIHHDFPPFVIKEGAVPIVEKCRKCGETGLNDARGCIPNG